MKKVVRVVWISALSGLAFLGACCSQNGLTRKERKQLTKERELVMMVLDWTRSIDVKGPLDDFLIHKDNIYALENKLDSISFRLGDTLDLDRNFRRRQILRRIDSLTYLIENYTYPCIYGSPEMMESGRIKVYSELEEYERELRKAQEDLDVIDRTQTKGPEIYEALYGVPDLWIER